MLSRTIAQAIARDAIQIEQNNAKILRDNLLKARAKLLKNPSAWQYEQYGKFLDEVLGEYEAAAVEDFPVEETLEHGTKEGRLFTGADLNIDKSAKFWGWSPVLPLNAIAIEESKFADLITKATADFKKEALRTVQQGLAMGASTQDLMDDLLGVGVSGAKGKDGKFRKAVTRAETIARTVSNDLINKGAMITYGQIDRISPELNLQKIWQTLSDNRTSDRCISLSGQKRELNEAFQAGDGWTGQNPPAHPNCRSRVTSRAANRNYTQAIDDRFAQGDIAAIATPQKEPAPLSDVLPIPQPKPLRKHTLKQIQDIGAEYIEQNKAGGLSGEAVAEKIIESLIREGREAMEQKGQKASDFVDFDKGRWNGRNIGKAKQSSVMKIADEFFSLVGGGKYPDQKIGFLKSEDRAWAHEGSGAFKPVVNIGSYQNGKPNKRVLFHELGHHIEYAISGLNTKSADFVFSKATQFNPVPLRELTGNERYDASEKAYPDHFVNPYVGKLYEDQSGVSATEVISMGLESFSDPARLAAHIEKDPDHINFIIGVIKINHGDIS